MGLRERKETIIDAIRGAENLADVLSYIGFEIEKRGSLYFTKVREERTKSAQINHDGTVHDHGNDDHFGFLDLVAMKYPETISHGDRVKNFLAQIEKAEQILRITPQGVAAYEFKGPKMSKEDSEKRDYITEPLEEDYVQYFRRKGIQYQKQVDELMAMFMPAASMQNRREAIEHFKIGYDPKKHRLTVPVRNAKGEFMHLFKYTNVLQYDEEGKELPKILYLSKRRRILFNISVLQSAPETLLILEGEKDVVNAHMNGVPAITQGAAGCWKAWMAVAIVKACDYYNVPIPRFVILQDHDKAGVRALLKIYRDLKAIQPETKVMFWRKETAKHILNWNGTDEKWTNLISEANLIPEDTFVVRGAPANLTKGFDYTDMCKASS